ncbi:competence protein ComK [Neobacillus pocheonensis]|uniref:competence protein ComK n=1 Tax=Neobacillus pocheonensis TaxID=363869 RepID=UPI003D2C420E
MIIKQKYLINEKTVLLYGVTYENGELFTFVIEGDDSFFVAMSPAALINTSLICYGSNLKGALESSQLLLGKKRKKYPIKIDASMDIWLFPTKSYKKENCIWFALNQVKNTQPFGVKFTKVFLGYGHTIKIEMKESAFRDKRCQAEELKEMITYNTKNSLNLSEKEKKGFVIVEENGRYKCKAMRNS